MSSAPVIELAGVDVQRDESGPPLLAGVNWRLGPGEFWVVSGPPASGKTSLLLTAAGLLRPGRGTLRLFGRDLAAVGEEEQVDDRQRIGFVYENGGRLLSHLSVYDNIALPLLYHSAADTATLLPQVDQALAGAELSGCALLTPSRVNLRQQRRASLLRALILPTEILFLDNPLGGLGLREERWWLDKLQELKTRGLTVVVAENDFRPWFGLADHFALVEGPAFRVITETAAREWS